MDSSGRNVVLLGRLGHGKTTVLNKMCGTRHAVSAGTKSCTCTVEHGESMKHKLFMIDTPGIGSSSDVCAHIAAQKVAVENIPISGVYVVVKYAHRVDDLAQLIEPVMDFLGTDDIRVIITHMDTVSEDQEGFDKEQLKQSLAHHLDLHPSNIFTVAKYTSGEKIEDFIQETLHKPKCFTISDAQIASIAALAGVRKYNKPINCVIAKIQAAAVACKELVADGQTYGTDLAIIELQNATADMVDNEKKAIFREATENVLTVEMQNLVYGKAGLSLSLKLQDFMKATNKFLTWDVTDPSDLRNQYRQCPHCDAVYAKEGGCDVMHCGDWNHVPDREPARKSSRKLKVEFVPNEGQNGTSFGVRFVFEGTKSVASAIGSLIAAAVASIGLSRSSNEDMQTKWKKAKDNGTAELNIFCNEATRWDQMIPIKPEQLELLGYVPLAPIGPKEKISRSLFHSSLNQYEVANGALLDMGARLN